MHTNFVIIQPKSLILRLKIIEFGFDFCIRELGLEIEVSLDESECLNWASLQRSLPGSRWYSELDRFPGEFGDQKLSGHPELFNQDCLTMPSRVLQQIHQGPMTAR